MLTPWYENAIKLSYFMSSHFLLFVSYVCSPHTKSAYNNWLSLISCEPKKLDFTFISHEMIERVTTTIRSEEWNFLFGSCNNILNPFLIYMQMSVYFCWLERVSLENILIKKFLKPWLQNFSEIYFVKNIKFYCGCNYRRGKKLLI